MMIPIPVLIGAGAAVALLVWLLVRRAGGRDLTAPPAMLRPRISVPTTALPAGLEDEVRECLSRRAKIEAIKHVREATGLGLKEAKDLVEAIEAGGTPL